MKILIAILALISFIAFKVYQVTRVPKGLENVPTISFLRIVIEIFTKTGADKRWENMRGLIEKEGIGKVMVHSFLTFKR